MAKIESGMEAMLDMFIFETNTLLEQLDEILLRTEQSNSFTDEDINEIFRIMHTVKGSAAMMGFENLSHLAHKAEDLFFIVRENPKIISDISSIYDLVFNASDFFKAEIELLQGDEDYTPTDSSTLISEIEKTLAVLNSSDDTQEAVVNTSESKSNISAAQAGQMTVRVFFEEGTRMENLRAFLLVNKIKDECEFLEYSPSDIETNSESSKIIVEKGFLIKFKAFVDNSVILKLIEEVLNVSSYEVIDNNKDITSAENSTEKQENKTVKSQIGFKDNKKPAVKEAVHTTVHTKQSLISVNLTKLDQLHDIVGEIITTESMVISNPDLAGMQLESFSKAARQLRKLTDELQDTVMSIRMVPLTGVFQKMNRIVRDMKIKLNKDVNFVIEGEQTEVDKSIVDNLNDPLMHLVRNCMDHGIESDPEQRVRAGKDRKGTITLSAQSSSGEIIIVVADDGSGIDKDKVLEKAMEKDLIKKPVEEYTDKEIYNMILLPGFSTNDEVTEFSGRGVGMDVVKQNIEKVGGSVVVESHKGKGTAFVIKIPLTLAIIDGMEIQVGESIFTIPISFIRESFKTDESQIIHDTQKGEMIMIRGVTYPILRLHKKFNITPNSDKIEDGILLLIETENKSVCVFADKLIGEHQVVVKPFPEYLNRYSMKEKGLSGCTILGDGNISLIIDANYLLKA